MFGVVKDEDITGGGFGGNDARVLRHEASPGGGGRRGERMNGGGGGGRRGERMNGGGGRR